jgi:hypothetical protein
MFGYKHIMIALTNIRGRAICEWLWVSLDLPAEIQVLTHFNIATQKGRKENLRHNFMPGH